MLRGKHALANACAGVQVAQLQTRQDRVGRKRPQDGRVAVICLQISMSVSRKTQPSGTAARKLLRLAEKQLVLRAKDVADEGIHTSTLSRLTSSGVLEKVGPGRYQLPGMRRATEQHDLAVAADVGSGRVRRRHARSGSGAVGWTGWRRRIGGLRRWRPRCR